MVRAKKVVLTKRIEGFPKETDFTQAEEELPPIKNGEFLTEAVYFSIDPYQRGYATFLKPGDTFTGGQVAKVIESKNPKYPVGKYVVGEFGWRSHTIWDNSPQARGLPDVWVVPDLEGLPLSLPLGILGMPGNTAYFGLLEILKPQAGETIVITAAGGAVGSTVGQIAKLKGLRVIGVAGSDEKAKWLVDELKFDAVVNYKKPDFLKKLLAEAPKGIDLYFDNVGGQISSDILMQMNQKGRIAVCGAISGYNDKEAGRADNVQAAMIHKELTMQGFRVYSWRDRWFEGILQNMKWIHEGKLKHPETVTEGFQNLPKAFIEMLQGVNFGKAIVKA